MTAPDWIYDTYFGNSLRDWTFAGAGAVVAIVAVV